MITYHYDKQTREYTHSAKAFRDPLESKRQGKAVYLLPPCATFTAPPAPKSGHAHLWNGTAWDTVEDNRGTKYWLADDAHDAPARLMQTLGALPADARLTPPPTPLAQLKADALDRAKTTFAARRDAVRWIGGYGFDCAAEDITNFMAAYTPLLVAGKGTAQYKVHLTDSAKGIVTLTLADLTAVYTAVRTSQLEAYAWYERVRANIENAQSADELDTLCRDENIEEQSR